MKTRMGTILDKQFPFHSRQPWLPFMPDYRYCGRLNPPVIDLPVATLMVRHRFLRLCFHIVLSVLPGENLRGRSTFYGAPALLVCRSEDLENFLGFRLRKLGWFHIMRAALYRSSGSSNIQWNYPDYSVFPLQV